MAANQTQKKILLPLDVSERSLDTVRYITESKLFHQMQVVLFHVHPSVPELYFDMKKDPRSTGTATYIKAWEGQQKRNAIGYMENARQMLIDAGFDQEAIVANLQKRNKGIARDIIKEAREGYDAVVASRRGLGKLRGIVLGSVANKLLEKLDFLPLLLVGRKTVGNKILLAFDGSAGAMRAIDFLKATLKSSHFEICLLHVIRARTEISYKYKGTYLPSEYIESIKKDMAIRLKEIKGELVQSGFRENRISAKIVTDAESRAAAIVKEARQYNYGTIVLGRRGLSQVRTFFIGRVTNKVVHLARDRTIWIVR